MATFGAIIVYQVLGLIKVAPDPGMDAAETPAS
jgi:hypothetical protein